jgi:phosphopantothenoylcysteine decarboxylase/phosphopantothenate--cysteine ligase
LGVTAGIAIYKACDIARRLGEKNLDVTVVMTPSAKELINPIIFEALTGNRVYSALFSQTSQWDIKHIALAENADALVIAPATANIIGKIASGICDDLLTCVICATKSPVLICPAMNEGMYTNKITRDNISKLKAHGYHFIEPGRGKLACGSVGVGCLADVGKIVEETERLIGKKAG